MTLVKEATVFLTIVRDTKTHFIMLHIELSVLDVKEKQWKNIFMSI